MRDKGIYERVSGDQCKHSKCTKYGKSQRLEKADQEIQNKGSRENSTE